MSTDLETYLEEQRVRVDAEIERLLPPEDTPPEALHRAMRYAVLSPGKRLRPILSLMGAEAVGAPADRGLRPGIALEMIHAYSLVHDDLPAMDDADLRRGRPTVHKEFGEALAILAGDALLTFAFELVAGAEPQLKASLLTLQLAKAAGSVGMVGGQTLDLEFEGRPVDEAGLERIHRWKTGALIRAAVVMGGTAGGGTGEQIAALAEYGELAGLAFQVADDLLDVESTPELLGKDTGSDAGAGKATYPALLGVEGARAKARDVAGRAARVADRLPGGARLRELAIHFVERKT